MSREWRDRWIGIAIGAISVAFTAGGAVAAARGAIHNKLDESRFVADSINRDNAARARDRRMDEFTTAVQDLGATWTRIYCRDHPTDSVCP